MIQHLDVLYVTILAVAYTKPASTVTSKTHTQSKKPLNTQNSYQRILKFSIIYKCNLYLRQTIMYINLNIKHAPFKFTVPELIVQNKDKKRITDFLAGFLQNIMPVWLSLLKKTAKLWDCRLSNFVPRQSIPEGT